MCVFRCADRMHVCAGIYVRVDSCTYRCAQIFMSSCTDTHVCVICMHTCVQDCLCDHNCKSDQNNASVSYDLICVRMYVCVYVCMYVCVYVCTFR